VFAALDVWSDTAVAAAVEESVVAEIPQPERKERPQFEPGRRFDRGRGPDRRDYPPRRGRDERGRDDRRKPDFRPDRPPRPYSRPEREPVPSFKSPPRPDRFPAREKSPERSGPSPFELKPDTSKPFSPDTARIAEPAKAIPPIPKKEAPESRSDDRRKLREKKHFSHGHDVDKKIVKEQPAAAEASLAPEKTAPSGPLRSVPPPPLIRELENPSESETQPIQVTKVRQEAESPETVSDEMQTSLFGRSPHRKGNRPKSDEPPKPVEEAETYSTKGQEFGRSTRKKKNN
jgi:hypothetical protein